MNPYRPKSKPRRRPLFRIEAECLEGRQLLTGGAGNTIALSTGTIAAAGGSATAPFVIESSHFAAPKGKITLGVDVVAASSSKVTPQIASVKPTGEVKAASVLTHATQAQVKASTAADLPHAVLANITIPRGKHAFSASFTTKVVATGNTSGDFLLGYYLPGDADGDGKVTQSDIKVIKGAMGKTVSDNDYVFDADSNRDGKITSADIGLAKANLGVSTTITPDFTANLDPATDDGATDRITNHSTVNFTGQAAPGAKINFTEVAAKSPGGSAVADSAGKYTVAIPLTPGTNTFTVSSVDAFGQTIKGSIQPVTYTTSPAPVATATTTTTT